MLEGSQYPNSHMDTYPGLQNQNNGIPPGPQAIMPMDPNIHADQPIDTSVFMACNGGIANGFGEMFFNIRDPTFTQKNVPVEQQSSCPISITVVSFILFGAVIISGVGFNNFLDIGGTIAIILVFYALYVIIAICCSDIRTYVSNMRSFGDFAGTYQKMRNKQGFFKFQIECYHFTVVRTKKGGATMKRIVTHTASQLFIVTESIDESGEIKSILDAKQFVFVHYLKKYYFTDEVSQNRFILAFNMFVNRNKRDSHQSYSHTFDIDGFEEFIAYSAMGDSKSCVMFYIFTLLGLALPYSCIFERYISRYDVGILKRLTV